MRLRAACSGMGAKWYVCWLRLLRARGEPGVLLSEDGMPCMDGVPADPTDHPAPSAALHRCEADPRHWATSNQAYCRLESCATKPDTCEWNMRVEGCCVLMMPPPFRHMH